MPTLNKVRLKAIKRKDKPDFILGENAEGTFFINSFDETTLTQLFKAANEGQLVDLTGSYKAPQAGSMNVSSLTVSPTTATGLPNSLTTPLK